jgi:hypothetical protein
MDRFTGEFKPLARRPDEPIVIGRGSSQARVSISEAERLVNDLQRAITLAELDSSEVLPDAVITKGV